MKSEYNNLAPDVSLCMQEAHSLSSLCEDENCGKGLVCTAECVQKEWKKLGSFIQDTLESLKEALVHTQESKSTSGQLDNINCMCIQNYILWKIHPDKYIGFE